MNRMERLDGIIAVPATPFTASDLVDEESLRRYVSRSIGQGVTAFLAPVVAGEVDWLSIDERNLVVRTIIDEAAGRVPVIGGASDPDSHVRLAMGRSYLEQGCAGILAYLSFVDEASYAADVAELASLEPGILMLQDLDSGKVPVSLLARLHREVPTFTWLKLETSDKHPKCVDLLRETDRNLRIGSAGPDLIELLDRGIHAYMPTLYHDIYNNIWSLHRAGDRDRAVHLWRGLLPCLAFPATHPGKHWHVSKAVLKAEGIFATTRFRVDAPELDAVESRLVAELAELAKDIADRVALSGPGVAVEQGR